MAESREELTREQIEIWMRHYAKGAIHPVPELRAAAEEQIAICKMALRSLSRDSRAAGKIAEFTNRDQKMFERLVDRRDLLQRRIDASESEKATEENRQEQHALDWAIARLCDGLQAPKSARTGGGK